MRRSLLLVGALLIGTSSMSSAAEVHIDEHTLCPVALRAFDETDLPTIEEFLRFVQGIFDELNARYTDQEETAAVRRLRRRNSRATRVRRASDNRSSPSAAFVTERTSRPCTLKCLLLRVKLTCNASPDTSVLTLKGLG